MQRKWARRRISRALATLATMAVALVLMGGQAHAAPCAEPAVEFLGISAANITLSQQVDGTFAGPVIIRVYCTDVAGDFARNVTGSQVALTTNVPNATFDGHAATLTTPAIINLPLGTKTIIVTSTDPGLAPGTAFARVGNQTTVATVAFGHDVPDGYAPSVTTNIFARTPELSSIVLLASGGAGALGYALLLARSKRRRS